MADDEIDSEFGQMWTKEKDNYVLVRRNDPASPYSIMNVIHNTTCIIEEDHIARYVLNKMIEHGVRIVDNFETVRNPNPPAPIFDAPELEEQYKRWRERQAAERKREKE